MGRIYTAVFEAVAITALQDLFEINAPADAVVLVHGFELFQTTDVADAAEDVLRLRMVRGVSSTSGSGGSTPTAQPRDDGSPAFGGTVEANNTTIQVVGGGSLETVRSFGWNIRIPMEKIFTPEERPIISPSQRLTLELIAAPADSITASGAITFEEIGG
jgi:hypothetical protein